jgi:hypothetical protein
MAIYWRKGSEYFVRRPLHVDASRPEVSSYDDVSRVAGARRRLTPTGSVWRTLLRRKRPQLPRATALGPSVDRGWGLVGPAGAVAAADVMTFWLQTHT